MANPNPSPETRFNKGRSGNPAGRPIGARQRLSESFLSALQSDFEEHGAATIAKLREERPQDYVRAVVAILPKELHVTKDPLEDLDDASLMEKTEVLANALGYELIPAAAASRH